jgi:ATP-dependent exoDNAse (exonuclease V) alpha subunit
VLPATLTGIEKYLGSGLVKGIGPIMAKRIVARFGLETLDIIEGSSEKLQEVEGIGPEGNKGSDGLSSRRGSELHLCCENLQGIR